jgi:hypothetical protein
MLKGQRGNEASSGQISGEIMKAAENREVFHRRSTDNSDAIGYPNAQVAHIEALLKGLRARVIHSDEAAIVVALSDISQESQENKDALVPVSSQLSRSTVLRWRSILSSRGMPYGCVKESLESAISMWCDAQP